MKTFRETYGNFDSLSWLDIQQAIGNLTEFEQKRLKSMFQKTNQLCSKIDRNVLDPNLRHWCAQKMKIDMFDLLNKSYLRTRLKDTVRNFIVAKYRILSNEILMHSVQYRQKHSS